MLVARTPAVITEIGPVVAAAGTLALICVAEFNVKVAFTLQNFTAVTPVKLVPLMRMAVQPALGATAIA